MANIFNAPLKHPKTRKKNRIVKISNKIKIRPQQPKKTQRKGEKTPGNCTLTT